MSVRRRSLVGFAMDTANNGQPIFVKKIQMKDLYEIREARLLSVPGYIKQFWSLLR